MSNEEFTIYDTILQQDAQIRVLSQYNRTKGAEDNVEDIRMEKLNMYTS
jgi:hypothetical protein